MQTTTVDIPTSDSVSDGYLVRGRTAVPGGPGLHGRVGLRPRLAEMAERIAARGYVVLVPNLFYRAGRAPLVDLSRLADPQRRSEIFGQLMPFIGR